MDPSSHLFFLELYLNFFNDGQTHDGAVLQLGIWIFIINFRLAILIGLIQPGDLSMVCSITSFLDLYGRSLVVIVPGSCNFISLCIQE